MTVRELITTLQGYDPEAPVGVWDTFSVKLKIPELAEYAASYVRTDGKKNFRAHKRQAAAEIVVIE